MVLLIMAASHTGKTALAQKLLEKYKFPYLSIDHLTMGLIRSGYTSLTPEDDDALTGYLWPVVREMIKTVIENRQNLIVEGCYIPFSWREDFEEGYLGQIRCLCLIFSGDYIRKHFAEIKGYANVMEKRLEDGEYSMESALRDNARFLELAREHGIPHVLMEEEYRTDLPQLLFPGEGAPS